MRYTLFALGLLLWSGCLVVNTTYDKLPPGQYRGVFYLDGKQSQRVEPDDVAAQFNLDDVKRDELPFNFSIGYGTDSTLQLTLLNGEERIDVADVSYERLLSTARDSITVRFPLNDTYFTGYHEDGIIEGYFVDETRDAGSYRIAFVAQHGVGHRFTDLARTPTEDLSGRWDVTFGLDEDEEPYPAIAELEQQGNELRGTFLTTTGDYRYLAGTVQADRAYLSVFDGSHVFLFSAKLQEDGTLLGIFRSATHYQTIWSAKRNAAATLPDPTSVTSVLDPEASLELNGLNLDGTPYTLSASPGTYTVVSLFGSWCPNCKDEALFLDSIRQTLPSDRIRFVGAAFERMADTSKALAAVTRFGESLNLDYPLVYVGSASKSKATEQLQILDRVRSFPTILILDDRLRVVYTHTGFAGPATSAYGDFASAFAKTLQTLLTNE